MTEYETCNVCGGQRPCLASHETQHNSPPNKEPTNLTAILREFDAGRLGFAQAINRAFALGIAEERNANATNDAKRADKIRDAFQSNYRAAMNMLSSLRPDERGDVLSEKDVGPDDYARNTARGACVATWGEKAVKAALGGGS